MVATPLAGDGQSLAITGIPALATAKASKCPQYALDFVTGSNQPPKKGVSLKTLEGLRQISLSLYIAAEGELKGLKSSAYSVSILDYPALPVSALWSPDQKDIDLLTQFGIPPSEESGTESLFDKALASKTGLYFKSIDAGVVKLEKLLASQSTKCPKTKILLSGYSQGALVIDTVTQGWLSSQPFASLISGIALVADPARDPNEGGIPDFPVTVLQPKSTDYGICTQLDPIGVCPTPIIMGIRNSPFASITRSICYQLDAVCDTHELFRTEVTILVSIYLAEIGCGIFCYKEIQEFREYAVKFPELAIKIHEDAYSGEGEVNKELPEGVEKMGIQVGEVAAGA